jgi:hypothetical protein
MVWNEIFVIPKVFAWEIFHFWLPDFRNLKDKNCLLATVFHVMDKIQLQYILITFSFIFVLSKVYHKILVSFKMVQNFEISDLVMAKVEKVNIAYTYCISKLIFQNYPQNSMRFASEGSLEGPWVVGMGRAWFFRARVGLGLHDLGSGLKKLLNKLGLIWARARALLYKWKSRA